jgi:hypothetical protein
MPNFVTESERGKGKEMYKTKRAFICGRVLSRIGNEGLK